MPKRTVHDLEATILAALPGGEVGGPARKALDEMKGRAYLHDYIAEQMVRSDAFGDRFDRQEGSIKVAQDRAESAKNIATGAATVADGARIGVEAAHLAIAKTDSRVGEVEAAIKVRRQRKPTKSK